jgi:CRP/FNR family transcriptional activator FtrB
MKLLTRIDDEIGGAVPLLDALSKATRRQLLSAAMIHDVAAGTILFEQGVVPNFQIAVISGSVQLFGKSIDNREVLVEVVRAPDLVIPAAVVSAAPYLMQARIPESSRLLLIHADVFRRVISSDPLLAQAVLLGLAEQFRRMVRQIKNLKLRTATERVGCYILALSAEQCTPHRAKLPYEKQLIASELGMTRESLSRAFASLEALGVRVDGQKIRILDPARLAQKCGPDSLIDGHVPRRPLRHRRREIVSMKTNSRSHRRIRAKVTTNSRQTE